MSISFQPAHKAELQVEVGKTSVEELQKFHDEVSAKGGGEIRAKKNKDGSHTLYVAADKKVRLSNLFGPTYGATARGAKQELAKDLMKEIIMRRLPGGDSDGVAGQTAKTLLSRIDQRHDTTELGAVLKDVAKTVFNAMPEGAKQKYGQLDTIMSTPGLQKAFGQSMKEQYCPESFEFIKLSREFNKTSNPHEKLKLAEQMFKMVESPENPSLSGGDGIGSEAPLQINLPGAMARKIHQEIQHLRTAITTGMEPAETDKQRLNDLFSEAEAEIKGLVRDQLANFTGSDAFKVEAAKVYARSVGSENDSSPASYLAPGSGKEFLENVQQSKDHFSTVENVLDDPEVRSAFREHLTSASMEKNLDHFEQVESLRALAGRQDVTDTELLKQMEELFLGKEEVPVLREEGLGLDSGLEPKVEDSHTDFVKRELGKLREALSDMHDLMGDSVESRLEQEKLFGSEVEPSDKEVLIRGQIKNFLDVMKADAANGMRGDVFESFKGEKLTSLIEKRVGDKMFNDQLDWRPEKQEHFGAWDRFAGKELVGSGGATGSGRGKVGKQLFQVKGSIAHAGLGRRMKAGGLNTENYGEVIASNISRAMVGGMNRHLIPEVALRQNGVDHEAMVTSKYLANGKGDLKDLYKELAGPLPRGQKHPKIHLDSPGRSGNGILRLNGQSSLDVQRNIALSALMGDHDVNPGNMIALRDGRVGRIDFGHAFNELISAPGGKFAGGGGVHNKSNRILDFFNRETVSGNPLVRGQNKAKLWRDYTGAGPSDGMTQALKEMASSTEALDGIVQAKTQFVDLIAELDKEGTPEAKKQIKDLTKSLAQISKNLEKPVTSTDPGGIVKEVFENLEAFIREGQDQMRDVANLSDLQTKIDSFINSTRDNPLAPVPPEIAEIYSGLTESSVKSQGGEGLVWMKMTDGVPAFEGTLNAFVQSRREQLSGL
jgi:hypothetical protein